MTEDEFVALLKVEGKELMVHRKYEPRWDLDDFSQRPIYLAEVVEVSSDGDITTIMRTPYVQRRYYAIQSLIKRYYDGRG